MKLKFHTQNRTGKGTNTHMMLMIFHHHVCMHVCMYIYTHITFPFPKFFLENQQKNRKKSA